MFLLWLLLQSVAISLDLQPGETSFGFELSGGGPGMPTTVSDVAKGMLNTKVVTRVVVSFLVDYELKIGHYLVRVACTKVLGNSMWADTQY